jgi:hypothetical protein
MNIDINTFVGISAATITAVGGLYTAFNRISFNIRHKKEVYRQAIIDQARSEMAKVKQDLEKKIDLLESEVHSQGDNIAKDMDHMRDIYNNEIRVLGSKIEELRQDLQAQHATTITLLTKLVDSK